MKNKIKSFLTSNTLISALVGAILTGIVSWFLLSKQIQDSKNEEIRKARIELIRDTERLFAQTEIVKVMFNQSQPKSRFSFTKPSSVCLEIILDGTESNTQIYNSSKEAYAFHGQYKSLSRLVPLYFCQKSAHSFAKLKLHDDWYGSQYFDLREEILNSMYQEIECKK